MRTSNADGFRISVSSSASYSSQGSADDIESLGDVFVWGEVWSDGVSADGSGNPITIKNDVLIPKALECNVIIDAHQISCGVWHAALVTRQGEVFTWGEESGGRLGQGIEKDFTRPHLVEFLAVTNIDYVACGEYHTCAVSTSGDLYTWGDGSHNTGLLAQGNDASHWIPKRISGPLEGLQVLSVACGAWHSALATANGNLFTFGDGTFGALGHGDRESARQPKEVKSLSGMKTIKVACGIWHTAAIVDVLDQFGATNISPRKLFTWGDGDKHRLGHGNKDAHLVPTCVSALVDYNFHQVACGHNITVVLTTSGHVFTMGSNAYGQLGNPQVEGKLPVLVQDRLVGEFVEEIACGSIHVAVLTSRSEVLTWGGGANGRLGLGDTEDRNIPTLVEALKDRHVKNIACGSNFTACVCFHKWVPGTDQSICTACRQPFGFTRKRHNCHNCGLAYCGACSSKKALRAALSATPEKPHRVCDSCYTKLKAAEAGSFSNFSRKATAPHHPLDSSRSERGETRNSRVLLSPTVEPVKYLEVKSAKNETKVDYSIVRASQVPSMLQLRDIAFPSSLSALQYALKPVVTAPAQPQQQSQSSSNTRPPSPYARRPSPPRSTTPVFSRGVIDSMKKTNDLLNQELSKLKNQVGNLRQKSEAQDAEIQKLKKNASEAASLVAEKSSKYNVAVEALKAITRQLKEITEKLPVEIPESETLKSMQAQAESFLNSVEAQTSQADTSSAPEKQRDAASDREFTDDQERRVKDHVDAGAKDQSQNGYRNPQESPDQLNVETVSESPKSARSMGRKEVIEQFEPGVYVTLNYLSNGTKIFKRVRFSKRRFSEQQAEEWWNKNKDRLLKKYNTPKMNNTTSAESSALQPAAEDNITTNNEAAQ